MNRILPITILALLLSACGTSSLAPSSTKSVIRKTPDQPIAENTFSNEPAPSAQAREVVMYGLMLLRTKYVFGGKNPEAGLDCSGLVHFVFKQAVNIKLEGNAAMMATKGKQVDLSQLRSGDLVFFNTMNRSFSHVGIYIGRGQFLHSPNSRGKVRIEKLATKYWAQRFETARTILG